MLVESDAHERDPCQRMSPWGTPWTMIALDVPTLPAPGCERAEGPILRPLHTSATLTSLPTSPPIGRLDKIVHMIYSLRGARPCRQLPATTGQAPRSVAETGPVKRERCPI